MEQKNKEMENIGDELKEGKVMIEGEVREEKGEDGGEKR